MKQGREAGRLRSSSLLKNPSGDGRADYFRIFRQRRGCPPNRPLRKIWNLGAGPGTLATGRRSVSSRSIPSVTRSPRRQGHKSSFPVRSASLLSRPDLAVPKSWRAPDLLRSEHRGTLVIPRRFSHSHIQVARAAASTIGRSLRNPGANYLDTHRRRSPRCCPERQRENRRLPTRRHSDCGPGARPRGRTSSSRFDGAIPRGGAGDDPILADPASSRGDVVGRGARGRATGARRSRNRAAGGDRWRQACRSPRRWAPSRAGCQEPEGRARQARHDDSEAGGHAEARTSAGAMVDGEL